MPRPLSSAARAAIFAQETGEAFIFLLELSHPDFTDTLRVCNNGENVTSNGQTYLWFPFELTLAGETDDTLPRARLRICNVDRRIVQAVRSVASQPVTARIALVMASTPDTIEAGRKYIGLPYPADLAAPKPGEYDCWQLVRHVYANQFGVLLPRLDYAGLPDREDQDALAGFERMVLEEARGERWREVSEEGGRDVGDLLLIRAAGRWHVGMVASAGHMLHTDGGR